MWKRFSIQHCFLFAIAYTSQSLHEVNCYNSNHQKLSSHGDANVQISIEKNNCGFGRRLFLSQSLIFLTPFVSLDEANAAQGAAEYDAEYYLRNLFNGNKGKTAQSIQAGPLVRDARQMQVPSILLDKNCSAECVVGKELSRYSGKDSLFISELVEMYREKSSRAFQVKSPWKEQAMTDQYYFDLTCYAVWRTAAELIPNFVERDTFARSIGRYFLTVAKQNEVLKLNNSEKTVKPTDTVAAVQDIMKYFESFGFIDSYLLGERNKESIKSKSKNSSSNPIFDEFDDDDFSSGLSINALLNVMRPATLGASLQITGEGSRFQPDFIGCTLAALWEECGYKVTYESYFVDNEYRPNPKDFFPDEQLYQFTLAPNR